MYTDNTTLTVANKNKHKLKINSYIALEMAKQYCYMNYLVLNENKTQQLVGLFSLQFKTI